MKVTQAINNYLRAKLPTHPGRDLVERFLEMGGASSLEVQVNVLPGDGEPVDGRRNTWTNGLYNWHNIRAPKNANTEPEFKDYDLGFPLDLHVEGIGSTGWEWVNKRSRYVGYDFDSLVAHAKGVGITDEQLAMVSEAAQALPYVEVRRSTGGKGIHLLVFLDGVHTENHTAHAALARCILGMMSSEVNFDFASQIDACGHVLWCWHRKMTHENQGLSLIKPASKVLTVDDLPANWRDHIEVVTKKRSKVRVNGIDEQHQDPFEALTASRRIVPLDASHKAVIQALQESGFTTLWVADHHLLQTHTCALQMLMDQNTLGLIGCFKTISQGKDRGTPNCFLFPLQRGGWRVYRFSPGIAEAETWNQDREGWTTTFFNRLPDFDSACKAAGGVKDPDKIAEYVFQSAKMAAKAADLLGQKMVVPEDLGKRETTLKISKSGKLAVGIQQSKEVDPERIDGWLLKKDRWVREFDKRVQTEEEVPEDAGSVRFIQTPQRESAGFLWQDADGVWNRSTDRLVKLALMGRGYDAKEAEAIEGAAIDQPWTLVVQPFKPLFPGGRQVNWQAPQYKVKPQEGPYPMWTKLLAHVGGSLTPHIKASDNPWFRNNGCVDGATYLRQWISCLLKDPFSPLPYLAAVGPEVSGKSSFHEAIGLLIDGGIASADRALQNTGHFNGELEGCVLAVVEECDLGSNKTARNRMKEWVTAKTLSIRRMRTNTYNVVNTLHFFQACNSIDHVPTWPGDSRITLTYVPMPEKPIPKDEFFVALRDEAPAFLHAVIEPDLPEPDIRLRIPIVETAEKKAAALEAASAFAFYQECCKLDPEGEAPAARLYELYELWCKDGGYEPVHKVPFGRQLQDFSCGLVRNGQKVNLNGQRVNGYKGLSIKPEWVDFGA